MDVDKPCNKCGDTKTLDLFAKDRRNKDGHAGICRDCRNSRDWRRSDHERTPTKQGPPDLNILSLGAGVQSTTMLLMAAHGEIPGLDAAIFADTGWEPPAVYRNLEWLTREVEGSGIDIHIVSAGNIKDDSLTRPEVSMPVFLEGKTRDVAMLRRQCTKGYKIDPVRKKVLDIIDRDWNNKIVDEWFGISWDELGRMSEPQNSWSRFRYPLVERRMTRQDCLTWMRDNGYPEPPRSACVCCPYRSDKEWLYIKADPELWDEAVEFDGQLRQHYAEGHDGKEVFLHRSLKPLSEVEFNPTDERGHAGCGAYCAT